MNFAFFLTVVCECGNHEFMQTHLKTYFVKTTNVELNQLTSRNFLPKTISHIIFTAKTTTRRIIFQFSI